MELRKFIATKTREYLNEQLENSDDTWYHGGQTKIKDFIKTSPINNRGNTEGFYFTKNINYARNHGNEITVVNLKIKNPFIIGKTNVSENMIHTYAIELHKENDHLPLEGSWIKEKCEYFKDKKYMPYTGLNGLAQQVVYKSGGFDSVIDGHEICVFDSNNIIILDYLKQFANESKSYPFNLSIKEKKIINESWYHGTPDAREIENIGGFTHKTMMVDYVTDPNGLKELQFNMKNARESGDMNLFHKLLNKVSDYKKDFTYKKPLFLSDKHSVAKTYADPQRAFDYQNSVPKIYEVDVNCNKIAKIMATGDRFRFISIDKVKQGFINSGISEEEIDKLILMFNYYISDNKGIKTDVIAAIGNWLDFDCIDVVGVLDSYHGGTVKSTVRMVLDPTNVKIKRT